MPRNFLLARNRKDKLLLADLSRAKKEQKIVARKDNTGNFTMFWADADARNGKYCMTSEVYAFGLCAHYLIWGQPLFDKGDKRAYENNTTKSNNVSDDSFLLQGIISWCLHDDPA